MTKIIRWLSDNILFLLTLFLLIFIPLYPKLPLINVRNTWVYVRLEDFFVLLAIFVWLILLFRRKVSIKTPLTLPIVVFWIIGAIATIHGIILIFPQTANVFPNVAFLAFARHLEYMSLFFIAFSSINNRKQLIYVIYALTITLLGVVAYGFGQKFAGFPAYLTMNEEYAKGVAITLSDLSRVPSTFGGHYDLAAYLVLVVPILVALIFEIKNFLGKLILLGSSLFGFALLFQTVSRVSFFALIVVLFGLLLLQKKKIVFFAIPLVLIFGFLVVSFKPTVLNRFSSTVKTVDVLVDGKTGQAIGEVRFVPASYFRDKIIKQQRVSTKDQLDMAITGQETSNSTRSAVLPFELLNPNAKVPLVLAANVSNGENLPQGTGYTNLSLAPVTNRVGNFFYDVPESLVSKTSAQVLIIHGDFIIKRASAYDLSFTTRFQGEWPHAILAFERNVLVGSGYGSVSLAVDNNYLRMLGETGILGTLAFLGIFLVLGIYIRKTWDDIDSPLVKTFILGLCAGLVGLAINATLIDVFEASKIAYLLWLLVGIAFGIIFTYRRSEINLVKEVGDVLTSKFAILLYLFILTFIIFSPILSNYFVGDDFTWFRWADCTSSAHGCSAVSMISSYFREASGFFYRPGTKIYFYLMYSVFWLNQNVYHFVSLLLHALVVTLFFFLSDKILKNRFYAALSCVIFVLMSGYSEEVFWIASTGHIFNALFILGSLLLFILWKKKKQPIYFAGSILSLSLSVLFHELGVVVPFLILLYEWTQNESFNLKRFVKKWDFLVLFVPILIYLLARFASGSHWQGGDYSYNLLKLPFNIVGNLLGYSLLTIFGPQTLSFYEILRDHLRSNIIVALAFGIIVLGGLVFAYKKFAKGIQGEDKRILLFGFGFFVISLAPFLGLGNITSRYSYLASLGLILVLVLGLKKLYEYLLVYGKDIAKASIVLVVLVFLLLHIFQQQQVQQDWHGAGSVSENFLVSIDDFYSSYWSIEPMELHFVNVPTKVGQAWVFPVGLPDALWFAFKNPDLKVYQDDKVTYDLQSKISRNVRVFEFNGDGSLKEIQPPKRNLELTPIVPAPR